MGGWSKLLLVGAILVGLCGGAEGRPWAGPARRGGAGRLAFFGKKSSSLAERFKFNNETMSMLRAGPSLVVLSNCTVNNPHLYALEPSHARGNASGGAYGLQSQLEREKKAPLEQVMGDLMQTVGGALFDVLCVWITSKIVLSVQGLWSKAWSRPPAIKFLDVIGCDYAKEEVMQLVDYLREPLKYKKLGAKIPRGVLLVGPPGVGKTMIARALAGEANVPFYYASGSDFSAPYWGVGVLKIKKLFRKARTSRRSIIFIDEFDALARGRRAAHSGSAEADSENTLNQLLTEMDGFDTRDNVIVLASTNRPEVLDKAVLRPGRFDRKVTIDPPDVEGRIKHFQRLLVKFKTDDDPNRLSRLLARLTPGFVGAEIVNVVNEAALRAAKRNQTAVTEEDLTWAAERTGFGIEKSRKMSSAQLNRTAVHETGHAVLAWMLPRTAAPVKISIINRGDVLGYNLMGESNRTSQTEEELRDEIAVLLGGRVAEEVLLGSPSMGAIDDLRRATSLARLMVERLGFGKRTGLLSVPSADARLYAVPEVSPETRRVCEEEAQAILAAEYARARTIVTRHRAKVNKLVQRLVEKEVIHDEEIEAILGARPRAD